MFWRWPLREGAPEKDVARLGAQLEDRYHSDQLLQPTAKQLSREDPSAADEMDAAARKIQAVYRGHLVRRQSQTLRDRMLVCCAHLHIC